MQIGEIVKAKDSGINSIGPEATLREAVRIACERRIGSLIVVEASGRLVGIITERDILRQVDARADFDTKKVGEVMTRDLVIGLPGDDIQRAMKTMTERRIRHLPVLEGTRILGVLSIGDVVKALLAEEELEIRYLRDYINH
jgi:CBS domain-containing protein